MYEEVFYLTKINNAPSANPIDAGNTFINITWTHFNPRG